MSVLWITGSCPRIAVNREKIEKLFERIKPVRFTKDGVEMILQTDLFNTAFTWEPKVQPLQLRDAEGQPDGLYEVARIETFHTCGYIALFKPSISEVLAQIPEALLEDTEYFETLTEDTVACFSAGDGHRTVTVLYSSLPSWDRAQRQIERIKNGSDMGNPK